jgi:hypothetical protein
LANDSLFSAVIEAVAMLSDTCAGTISSLNLLNERNCPETDKCKIAARQQRHQIESCKL